MKLAKQALFEWQAQQRIQRAVNSRAQREHHYRPGDLVYFLRKPIKQPGIGKNGAFLGPARILCTETRREPDGQLRPGSAIWCVRGRRVLKCSPEQLRPASHREELLGHLTTDEDQKAPWTFPRITQELGGNEYEDISKEIPDLEEWHRAQDIETQPTAPEGLPTPRVRRSHKRPVSPGPESSRSPFERRGGEAKAIRTQNPDADQDMDSGLQTSWWNQVEETYKKTNTQGDYYGQNKTHLSRLRSPEKLQNESQCFPFSTTARRSKQRRGIAARPSIAMGKSRYNQVPQFVGLETPAFRAPQTPCHASTRPHASTQVHFVRYEFLVWRRRADGYRTSRDYPMIGVLEQINQVPRFVGLETVAFRAPQTPYHAITMPHASSQVGPHHRVTSAQLLLF